MASGPAALAGLNVTGWQPIRLENNTMLNSGNSIQ
jgi:hypothetical protein